MRPSVSPTPKDRISRRPPAYPPRHQTFSTICRVPRCGEAAALVDDRRVFRVFLADLRDDLGTPFRRAVLRFPAEEGRVGIVPPALVIVGRAVDDGVAEARGVETVGAKGYQITNAEPCRQHTGVQRLWRAGAYAHRQGFLSELVEIIARQVFTEAL